MKDFTLKIAQFLCLLCFAGVSFAWDNDDVDTAWRSENLEQLANFSQEQGFLSLYAHYRLAMVAINKDEKKIAKKSLDVIKDALKGKYQTPDEAALYSTTLGLSITLKPWQAAFIASGAEDALDFSFAKQDDHAPTLMVKGIAMFNTPSLLGGDKALALEYFNKAISLYKTEPAWGYEDALLWRVKALQTLGDSDAARQSLAALQTMYPDFVEANDLDLNNL